MGKDIKYGLEAKKALKEGVDIIANAVSSTLGGGGSNVMIKGELIGSPLITKDGVTVAKAVEAEDSAVEQGIHLMREVALNTNNKAGDGCQPLWAKVQTPQGPIPMGDIKKGDVICGTNGTTQLVLDVFVKEPRNVYKVTFSDGRHTYCSADHLWSVYTEKGGRETKTLERIILEGYQDKKICIPVTEVAMSYLEPIKYYKDFKEAGNIFGNVDTDGEILKEGSFLRETLVAPIEKRKEFLAGLKEAKCSLSEKGLLIFYSHSKELAEAYLFLIRSLGYIATEVGYNDEEQQYEVLEIDPKEGCYISNISLHSKETVKCIKVSNEDSLYLTDDFIVTHNTTTSIVLAQAIVEQGMKEIEKGTNAILLQRELLSVIEDICEELKTKYAKSVDDNPKLLESIATTSVNNDKKLGELIHSATTKAGKYGKLNVEISDKKDGYTKEVKGYSFNTGLFTNLFLEPNKRVLKLKDPLILVTNKKIEGVSDFGNTVENVINKCFTNQRTLVIICNEMSEFFVQNLVTNRMTNNSKIFAVKAPEFGEEQNKVLMDIAVATGGTYFDEGLDHLKDATTEKLGTCETIELTTESTTIFGGHPKEEELEDLLKDIKEELEEIQDDASKAYSIERLRERYSKLRGNLITLCVGATSETEAMEIKDRVEDAILACKASLEGGVLAGGGVSLLNIKTQLDKQISKEKDEIRKQALTIMSEVVTVPFKTIASNAGLLESEIAKSLLELNHNRNMGLDVQTGTLVNMYSAGILDPLKVTTTALRNAGSVASTLLTTNCIIT